MWPSTKIVALTIKLATEYANVNWFKSFILGLTTNDNKPLAIRCVSNL